MDLQSWAHPWMIRMHQLDAGIRSALVQAHCPREWRFRQGGIRK